MTHPLTFDAGDPPLVRVRAIALAMPGAAEKLSHGMPAFFTTKVFAYYGGTTKAEHRAGLHPPRLSVLLEPDERLAMLADGAVEPAYLGPYGWVAVDLDDTTDWVRMGELIDASFRVTAPKRLVAELDARA
jgi:hypothetical protein